MTVAWYRFRSEARARWRTPVPVVLLAVPSSVLLANLVAAVPARAAARTRPALILRSE